MGAVTVRLPRALLQYWSGPPAIEVEGSTLAQVLANVDAAAPGLAARILDDQGHIRRHVAVILNGDILSGGDASTIPVNAGDQVRVVPAVSGG